MLTLLAACVAPDAADVTDATGNTLGATAIVDARIATLVHVSWSSGERATVEYERPDGSVRTVEGDGTVTLYGLHADADVRWRIADGEWQTARTGALPDGIPAVVTEGELGADYVLLSWQEFPAEGTGVYILDGDGQIVWYHLPEVGIVPAAHDVGGALLLMWTYHDVIENAAVEYVPLDGADPTVDPLPYAHHDVVAVPGLRYASIVGEVREIDGEAVVGDTLVEVAEDGSQRTVWSAFDVFPVVPHESWDAGSYTAGHDWTHANGLYYDPVDDAYLVSLFYLRSVAKIDRATGATLWVLGGDDATIELLDDDGPRRQHAPEWRDGALTVFDNGYGDALGSRLVTWAVDEAAGTATRTWEWRHPDALFTFVFGDVDLLPDGGHLSSWGNYGQVLRTDAAGEVVWSAQVDAGHLVAQAELFDGF